MLSALALFITFALWYVLFKYRVHFHFEFHITRSHTRAGLPRQREKPGAPLSSEPAKTRAGTGAPQVLTLPSTVVDLESALVNLGTRRIRAREIASAVCSEAPGRPFDDMLRTAIDRAREAA